MLRSGANISLVDLAVFYWKNNQGTVRGILECHVDDWGGTIGFQQEVISKIRSTLCVGCEHGKENEALSYFGIELSCSEEGIHLQQRDYLNNLHPIHLEKSWMLQRHSTLTKCELQAYQSKIGQILWIARQTRPDVILMHQT